jgi:hypothetical protein
VDLDLEHSPAAGELVERSAADPDTRISIGAQRRRVIAALAGPEERAGPWPRLVAAYADFDSHQSWTERELPVGVLRLR